jgi:penicillin-binding protein 1A
MQDTDLFQIALGLVPPWFVERSALDPEQKRLDIYINFSRGDEFPCPECGRPDCKAHDTLDHVWRHLNLFQHVTYLHVRVPRVDCPDCGVKQVPVPWARAGSGFTLLLEASALAMTRDTPIKLVARLTQAKVTFWNLYARFREQLAEFLKRQNCSVALSRLQPVTEAARTIKRRWDGVFRRSEPGIINWLLNSINGLIQAAKPKARAYGGAIKNFVTNAYSTARRTISGLPRNERGKLSGPGGPEKVRTGLRANVFRFSARRILWALALLSSLAVVLALGAYLAIAPGVPESVDLKSYQPKSASVFYTKDGSVLGWFYNERRFPVALDAVPKHVTEAIIAAEDRRFLSHSGIDPRGTMRAAIKNFWTGTYAQGGSTITQQVARNVQLTREKKILRKLREMLLAVRMERSNSKAQILEAYLNEIYLGRGAYGIEAAAQSYFGKRTADLTISEAAYLAGLISNPSKYGPDHIDNAQARKKYTLHAMLKLHNISPDEYNEASQEKLNFLPNVPIYGTKESYFTEAVRRYIISKYGEKALYQEGLRVWTTLDTDLQAKAQEALLNGVRAWEEREGRPAGLVKRLTPAEAQNMKSGAPETNLKPGASVQAVVVTGSKIKGTGRNAQRLHELTAMLNGGQIYGVSAESKIAYRKNDLLTFGVKEGPEGQTLLEHDSLPPVQGALVSIENNTGYIRALVGGTGSDRSGFNRASQAVRQLGSAFKPVVYSAALEWGKYDPRTVIVDEPIAVKTGAGNPDWIPENPDGRYQGPLSLEKALVQSRNIPAVKVMMDLGPEAIIQMARNMGIKSPVRETLSSALGASEATPLEMTAAFSVFPNLGVRVTPVLVLKITDGAGNVLEDNTMTPLDVAERARRDIERGICVPAPKSVELEQKQAQRLVGITSEPQSACRNSETDRENLQRVLSPQTAYLMVSMLRGVTISGTASLVKKMGRTDLAGKTGSTNDYTDAWFIGFNPTYTTGVWIGHDTRTTLGKKEFGGKAALPVWIEYMAYALRNESPRSWSPPSGIEFAGYRQPGKTSPEKLLTASPHFAPGKQLKPVSPVDVVPALSDGGPDSDSMWWGPATYGAFSYDGALRVLSPRGKTLGIAAYTQDEKGNLALQQISPGRGFRPEGFGLNP